MKKQLSIYADIFYIVVLGVIAGTIFCLGALTAPVVFRANLYTDLALDVYQSGRIMSEIFRRLVYILGFAVITVAAYEIWYFCKKRSTISIAVFAVATIVFASIFAFYQTPVILSMQTAGIEALQTTEFANIHTQSETVFKCLLIAILGLIITRIYKLIR